MCQFFAIEIDYIVYSEAKPLAVAEWGFNEISNLSKRLEKHVGRNPREDKEMGETQREQAAGARQEHVEQEGNNGREKTKRLHGNNFNPDMRSVRKVF